MSPPCFPARLAALGIALALAGCDRAPKATTAAEVAVAPATEPALGADDEPAVVFAKAVKAHGGDMAFTRWGCGRVKYLAEGSVVPALLGKTTMEDTFRLPGHFKRVAHMNAGGKGLIMVSVLSHGAGWTKMGAAEAEPAENPFTERSEHTFGSVLNLLPYRDGEVRLTRRPQGAGDDRPRVTLRAEGEGFEPADLCFDAATGLLHSVAADAPPPAATGAVFENYRAVQGGMVPMRMKGTRAGELVWQATLLEVEFRDTYDDAVFAKP